MKNTMLVKDALEILQGRPCAHFEGDPLDIPCIETSDAQKLCKTPLVSVHMVTYNHEPYIRQAIEGVMMQKTDFEFELVIGEDASQDKTREICFEYQKKYPDKVRVLWWHENVSKLGGNGPRNRARCRGQFIAFCEGDDYWIDPLKLQKQVDLIRNTGAVMCVADSEWHFSNGEILSCKYHEKKPLLNLQDMLEHYFHTTTYLIRYDVYLECQKKFPNLIYWYDTVVQVCMATMGRICYLPEIVSVYNRTGNGVSGEMDSPKYEWLLATQFLQFTYCSERMISDFFYKKFLRQMRRMYTARLSVSYRYSSEERKRMLRAVFNAVKHKKGRLKAYYMFMKFCVYYFIKSKIRCKNKVSDNCH